MKKLFFLSLLVMPFLAKAQNGQIISITTNPANPTTADFVEVYVELMFTSGGCDLDYQAHNTSGNSTTASAHHCVGMLTVICSITDTFDLGYLQAGNHQFNFTLSSGSGGPGCSPGIVPDDSDILNFTVTSPVGVDENSKSSVFKLFPNPSSEEVVLEFESAFIHTNKIISVTDISGKMIYSFSSMGQSRINLPADQFSKGIYSILISNQDGIIANEKMVRY